jgi:hypothetical protein
LSITTKAAALWHEALPIYTGAHRKIQPKITFFFNFLDLAKILAFFAEEIFLKIPKKQGNIWLFLNASAQRR